MTVRAVMTAPPRRRPADDLRAFVADTVDRAVAAHAETVVVSVPAPLVSSEALLRVEPGDAGEQTALLWHPEADGLYAFSGVGTCWRIDLSGPHRFADLRQQARHIWRDLVSASHPDVDAPSARFFGGLAFSVGAADDAPWRGFGDGGFVLPRLRYASDGEAASLSLAVRAEEWHGERESMLDRLDHTLAGLAAADRVVRLVPELITEAREVHVAPIEQWTAQIDAIRGVIRDGGFRKIVAARRSEVELAQTANPGAVLERLSRGLVASTRFAFCRPGATFLGATPERLVRRIGRTVLTDALAGSIAVGETAGDVLLASDKDREEHRLVVEDIVTRLRPLTERLDVAPRPEIRALREVLHLLTPIAGELRSPAPDVIELAEALHPTPAVGGVPTADALHWITTHEPAPRGWYAGPIGWFDAAGDGDFAVALRSCVLAGHRAYLYAGAGIVADSDPVLEYHETELKKQAMLAALGVAS
ncbi:MAG: isochorismate synthase [Acidobacteriota bacterium]